jgi:hypothetical protein
MARGAKSSAGRMLPARRAIRFGHRLRGPKAQRAGMSIPFDVSRLLPAAQPVAHAVAQVCWKHTRPWFAGLLCFGSAAKGSIIPGASDIDFHLYLEDAAFTPEGTLPLELYLRLHRDLARIDPAPFRYIDAGVERIAPLEEGHIGPIPGAYHLIAGRLPIPEATARDLRDQATWALRRLVPMPPFLTEGLLHHGQGRGQLALTVRKSVWPVLFQVLCLQQEDPLAVWRLPGSRRSNYWRRIAGWAGRSGPFMRRCVRITRPSRPWSTHWPSSAMGWLFWRRPGDRGAGSGESRA